MKGIHEFKLYLGYSIYRNWVLRKRDMKIDPSFLVSSIEDFWEILERNQFMVKVEDYKSGSANVEIDVLLIYQSGETNLAVGYRNLVLITRHRNL